MTLTQAQKTTLKAAIAANATTLSTIDVQSGNTILHNQTVAIQNVADIGDNYQRIAEWYNLATTYFVWQTAVQRTSLDAQITKANFTPSDPIPAGPSTDMTYQNRALLCQLKQANAQWETGGGVGTLDARLTGIRQIFKDCLTAIPSGASGANQDAGWGTAGSPGVVRLAMMRFCTNLEKLFVTSASSGPGNDGVVGNRGTNTNPDLLVLEGNNLNGPDVSDAILNG